MEVQRLCWLACSMTFLVPCSHAYRLKRRQVSLATANHSVRFGALETWLIIDAAINLKDAYSEMEDRTTKMKSLTSKHVTSVQQAMDKFSSASYDQQGVMDLLKNDPLADIMVAVDIVEKADKLCTTRKNAWARIQHWPQDAIDFIAEKLMISDPELRKQMEANAQTASAVVHAVSQRLKHNLKMMMSDTVCPGIEKAALQHLARAEDLVRQWEDVSRISWYLMRERQVQEDQILGHRLSQVSLIDHEKCLSDLQLKEEAAHRDQYGEINLDHYAELVESPSRDFDELIERERDLSKKIDSELAIVEKYLEDLNRHCDTPDLYAKLKAKGEVQESAGAGRMLVCDAYMVTGSRWAALLTWATGHAATGGKAVEFFVKYIGTPLADFKLIHALFKTGHFGPNPVIPMINALSWIALRASMNIDVHDECLRIAGALSGENPITLHEMELLSAQVDS